MAKIELEHVAQWSVWRVSLDEETMRGELLIRGVDEQENIVPIRWCRGCRVHGLPGLDIELGPEQPRYRHEALADVNAKLRDLIAGTQVN